MTGIVNSHKRSHESYDSNPKRLKSELDFQECIEQMDPLEMAVRMLPCLSLSDMASLRSVNKRTKEIAEAAFILKAKEMGYRGNEFAAAHSYIYEKWCQYKTQTLSARLLQLSDPKFYTELNPDLVFAEAKNTWISVAPETLEGVNITRGYVALNLAAFFNQTKIVSLLLDRNVLPNQGIWTRNPLNQHEVLPPPLHCAILKGNIESAQKLMDRQALVSMRGGPSSIQTPSGLLKVPSMSTLRLAFGDFPLKPFHHCDEMSFIKNTVLNIPMLRFLLQKGIEIKAEDVMGVVRTRSVEALKLLLEYGAEFTPEIASRALYSLIYGSYSLNRPPFDEPMQQMISFLFEKGADANFRMPISKTKFSPPLLETAAHLASFELIQLLVEKGADVAASDEISPLIPSIINDKNRKLAEYLLENGADINRIDESNEGTYLHYAIAHKHLGSVRFFVEHKANLFIPDTEGRMPLHLAVEKEALDIVEYLLSKGVSVNLPDAYGNTPLTYAYRSQISENLIEYLITKGAALPLNFKEGQTTPLHLTAKRGNMQFLQNLGEVSIEVDHRDSKGDTALHLASANGSFDVVKYLVEKGADITLINAKGLTPLHLAVRENHLEVVQFFLKQPKYADYDETSSSKPLVSLAVSSGSLELVQAIVTHGFDVDLAIEGHFSPLCKAAHRGSFEIVRFLLEQGADVEDIVEFGYEGDERPHNALTLACYKTTDFEKEEAFCKIVSLLLNHGAQIIVEGEDGETYSALDLARKEENERIVNILDDYIESIGGDSASSS